MSYESCFNYEEGTETEKCILKCKEVLFSEKTKFQSVDIYDTYRLGKVLILDGIIQSSQHDEYRYHEALVHPAMLAHPNPESVLIIGGGEGATAREVLKHPSVKHCVMVDIDGELVEQCKKHLPEWHQNSFSDPRLELIIGDGLEYVAHCDEIYDVIIIDVCDSFEYDSPTISFFSAPFFRQLKSILELKGIVVYQAMCASIGETDNFVQVHNGLNKVFTFATPYTTYIPAFRSEWGFVVTSDVADVATMKPSSIKFALSQRNLQPVLRFIDEVTLRSILSVPKDIRALFATSKNGKEMTPINLERPLAATASM